MCHPGIVDGALRAADSLCEQRELEYQYFLGDEFGAILESQKIALCKFEQLTDI